MTLRYDVLSVAWYVISKPASGGGTFTNGTFTPVYNGAGIVGSVQFQAKYQITGNVVTLGLEIAVGAFSSFTFTLATDYFDGIPFLILPVFDLVSGTPVGDNFSAIFTRALGTARITFIKPGVLTLVIPASTSIQYTVATYLI
jgi:hypothetical protein